jgi:hypothetical protein
MPPTRKKPNVYKSLTIYNPNTGRHERKQSTAIIDDIMGTNIVDSKQSIPSEQQQTPTAEHCEDIELGNEVSINNNSPQNSTSLPTESIEINGPTTVFPNSAMEDQSIPNHDAPLQQRSVNEPNFNITSSDIDNFKDGKPLSFSPLASPPHMSYTDSTQSPDAEGEGKGEGSGSGSEDTLNHRYQSPPPPPGILEHEKPPQISPPTSLPPMNRGHFDFPQLVGPPQYFFHLSTLSPAAPKTSVPSKPQALLGKLKSRSISRSREPELKVIIPPRPSNLPRVTIDKQYTQNPQPPQPQQTSQAQGNNPYELDSQQIAARVAFLKERQQRRNEHMQARIQTELRTVPVKR